MYIGSHSGFVYRNHYYFGAYSNGFITKFREQSPRPNSSYRGGKKFDSYVFKYDPLAENKCLYEKEIT